MVGCFFCKQETAYEMRISDWSSDVCSADLVRARAAEEGANPLTVAKAYQTFQDEGLVTVKRGVGMFVAPGATERLRDLMRADLLTNIWPPVVQQIRQIGRASLRQECASTCRSRRLPSH